MLELEVESTSLTVIFVRWHNSAARLAAVNFVWFLVLGAFFLGTFPSALLIGRIVGHNPMQEGSGNPGATNMFRIAGLRAGGATLVIDVLKALVATLFGHWAGDTTLAAACGAAAVVGHVFPLVRSSRGGKGVACFGGLTIGAWPILAPIALAVWIGSAKLSGHSFVGAMVGTPMVAIGTMVMGRPITEVLISWAMTVLIVARHHTNISDYLAIRSA
ncbi:MAG: glycerol-3-phosphate acyltransferase PlsY [Acidimicrobiales bacterium]